MASLLLIGITYYYSYWFSIRRYPVLQLRDTFPFQVFSYIGTKKKPLYFLIISSLELWTRLASIWHLDLWVCIYANFEWKNKKTFLFLFFGQNMLNMKFVMLTIYFYFQWINKYKYHLIYSWGTYVHLSNSSLQFCRIEQCMWRNHDPHPSPSFFISPQTEALCPVDTFFLLQPLKTTIRLTMSMTSTLPVTSCEVE